MKQEFHVKQKFCLVNSYRNTISKWALGFRYRNFFIPWVEKNLKISPWEGNSNLPRAYGPWEDRVSSLGLIFGGFFNPWDEEISIRETRPIRKSYISCRKYWRNFKSIKKFIYLVTDRYRQVQTGSDRNRQDYMSNIENYCVIIIAS